MCKSAEYPEKVSTPPIVCAWQALWKDLTHPVHDSVQRNIAVMCLSVM